MRKFHCWMSGSLPYHRRLAQPSHSLQTAPISGTGMSPTGTYTSYLGSCTQVPYTRWLFLQDLYIYLKGRITVWPIPQMAAMANVVGSKPGSRNLILVLHVGAGAPALGSSSAVFLRCISRELDPKWSRRDSNRELLLWDTSIAEGQKQSPSRLSEKRWLHFLLSLLCADSQLMVSRLRLHTKARSAPFNIFSDSSARLLLKPCPPPRTYTHRMQATLSQSLHDPQINHQIFPSHALKKGCSF